MEMDDIYGVSPGMRVSMSLGCSLGLASKRTLSERLLLEEHQTLDASRAGEPMDFKPRSAQITLIKRIALLENIKS